MIDNQPSQREGSAMLPSPLRENQPNPEADFEQRVTSFISNFAQATTYEGRLTAMKTFLPETEQKVEIDGREITIDKPDEKLVAGLGLEYSKEGNSYSIRIVLLGGDNDSFTLIKKVGTQGHHLETKEPVTHQNEFTTNQILTELFSWFMKENA